MIFLAILSTYAFKQYAYAETTDIKVVTGSAISTTASMLERSSPQTLLSASASSAHVHTDACYEGHRHTPVYGSTDLSGVMVYVSTGFSTYFPEDGKYMKYISISCAECQKTIYSIRYNWTYVGSSQGIEGYTIEYEYDAAGNAYPTKKPFNFTQETANYNYVVYSIVNSWDYWASTNRAGEIGNQEYVSYSTPWIFGTYPTWDASGVRTDNTFTGCKNIYAHPNRTCYPVGDRNKLVNVECEYSYINNTSDYSIIIKCATCGNTILSITTNENWNYGSYGTHVSNSIINQLIFTNSGGRLYESIRSSTDSSTNDIEKISKPVFDYCKTLPNQTIKTNNEYTYKFTCSNVKWEYNNFYYMKSLGSSGSASRIPFITGYTPYSGCVYCGTYGANYSCGQVQDDVPDCNRVVTSITPVYPIQTIYSNNPIDTTATATYLDGHTAIVNCATYFDTSIVGMGRLATLVYSGLIGNVKTSSSISCTATIDVIPKLSSISVVPSSSVVYNGAVPTYTVTAIYMDGASKILTSSQYSSYGWTSGYGSKTVVFSYSEGGKTVSSSVVITVKPNITGLSITPSKTSAYYGENIDFVKTATYENGNSTTVAAICTQNYNRNLVGVQTISYSYTENGITKGATVNVTVLDYPLNISVTLQNNDIYQNCDVIISTYTVNFASGATSNDAVLNRSSFDNIQLGTKTITYSYKLNGVTVSCDKVITIKPDLYDITLDTNTFEIYKGQEPEINVTANFHISGEIPLTPDEFTITGFNNNIFDRTGTYYTLSYTSKGITISKQVFICVLPNITSMTVSAPPQTTEGIQIPFGVIVQYEDGVKATITDADIGGESGSRLSILGYDINRVGYQDTTFQFNEGGRTLTETVNIRVRALINISIPLNMLISIDPNISGPGGTISPDITLNNASKEPVIISVQSIVPIGGNELKDVLPTAHTDWTNLGKRQSKDIAIGLNCKNNWLINYLQTPLYIAQITSETDVGQIDKETVGSIELLINHGNSHSEHREFTYNILWHIRLTE